MADKLTLKIDEDVIRRAKDYGRSRGVSVSRLVERYLLLLTNAAAQEPEHALSPAVQRLRGAVKRLNVTEEDYREHLWQKHVVQQGTRKKESGVDESEE